MLKKFCEETKNGVVVAVGLGGGGHGEMSAKETNVHL